MNEDTKHLLAGLLTAAYCNQRAPIYPRELNQAHAPNKDAFAKMQANEADRAYNETFETYKKFLVLLTAR